MPEASKSAGRAGNDPGGVIARRWPQLYDTRYCVEQSTGIGAVGQNSSSSSSSQGWRGRVFTFKSERHSYHRGSFDSGSGPPTDGTAIPHGSVALIWDHDPVPERQLLGLAQSPFRFDTGYALCAKRPPRPFPPPFVSPPSSSFSDPLTTHALSQDKRLSVRGELVRGLNNGDDAIIVAENFLGVDDGVGAWATKPHGHAALWSRLLLHFWALEIERRVSANASTLDPIEYLQTAYEETIRATTTPTQWLGTTTSATALLHWTRDTDGTQKPLLYVTNLGDCKILVIRPSEDKVLFRTIEQWHWFDCPMQLGTNSVDTPRKDAVLSKVALQENDIVLALSDGVMDNLWEHEVQKIVQDSLKKWDQGHVKANDQAPSPELSDDRMVYVARELLNAALNIAQDPFAESPYMEKAVDEGIAIEGGKMDDISVVVASCQKRAG